MILEFEGEVIYWRGPAPFVFVSISDAASAEIKSIAKEVTYGWGCIPVRARIGSSEYTTALFPKNGRYLLPVKIAIQKSENIDVGQTVRAILSI